MITFSVLIRCNAGYSCGYGHVSRCLALARAFTARGGAVTFVLDTSEVQPLIAAHGHEAFVLEASDPDASFVAIVGGIRPDIVVLDVRPPHGLDALQEIREKIRLLVVLDDVSEQRLIADVVYLPPVPGVLRADWTAFTGVKRVGLQWMLTGGQFTPPPYRKPVAPYRLLMTMGGSDPWGYTQRLAPVFARICHDAKMPFGVVVGPGFKERDRQIATISGLPGTPLVFDNPSSMGAVYDWCDMAVVPMCVSAYELARSAKPSLYICPDEDYKEHAQVFENQGFGRILPLPGSDDDSYYKKFFSGFVSSGLLTSNMHEKNKTFFTASAAESIASDIWEQIM